MYPYTAGTIFPVPIPMGMATGGALQGLDLMPQPLPTGADLQDVMNLLSTNLKAAAVKAVINTAVYGGSFEDQLKTGLLNALIDTGAAKSASLIGDAQLDSFTNKVAHAIAGCMAGAAKADNTGGCGAGALGAALGEIAAEAYGRQEDTIRFASLISALGIAVAGGDPAQIAIAQDAGANAAANNYLSHQQIDLLMAALNKCAGDRGCIVGTVAKFKLLDASQSEGTESCSTSRACTELALDARSGFVSSPSQAQAQAACGGEPICLGYLTTLDRQSTIDEIAARDRANALPILRAQQQLEAQGLSKETAAILAQMSPADMMHVASSMGGAVLSGVRSYQSGEAASSAVNALNLNKYLASQQQISELSNGGGSVMAGAGSTVPLRDASRLAAEYGGSASDWSKVSSSSYTGADGVKFEIHAYRNPVTGQLVEPKTIQPSIMPGAQK
ncbi:Possible hemagglutinin [Pseudacidovorax sp. RU35E]|nr:Possible hemagglutinin [Pseudacidovorax sp. RU35E]